MSFEGKSQQEIRKWTEYWLFWKIKEENGPRASSAPALGLNTIILKHVYWYMLQISGERLQDHWSSCIMWAATRKNRSSGFQTWSDTNQPVQSQKQARSLKIRIHKEEGLCYPSSENEGADQMNSYCTVDLRLCFCICKNLVFWWCGSYMSVCLWVSFSNSLFLSNV